MNFVLDASVTLSWCFVDEATPMTNKLLNQLEESSVYVPELWSLEVGNILINAERHKRITYAKIVEFLSLLSSVNIHTDQETAKRGFREIMSLAHAEHLTTYDAAYLELSMRLGIPLATRDNQLLKVAKKLGIKTIKNSIG